MNAAEQFSEFHDTAPPEVEAKHYRRLLPLATPQPGEQYAFEVDLDACTGCKSCVTACHSRNDLDESETWRSVGLLHGGTASLPILQTVTSSCHHCLDPACLKGCPARAYHKDPVTGIVKHDSDACIGCQYCTLTCPYDAPKFNNQRGIIRKCDMCSDRLGSGEAPACVEGCPNDAIAIRIASEANLIEENEVPMLPGTPDPMLTLPTTHYKSSKLLPRNTLPADHYAARSSDGHAPLVVMLVLTQLSVGAFVISQWFGATNQQTTWVALVLGLSALGASVLHLGRPERAYRAILGFRWSWLSREIMSFGLFSTSAIAYALLGWTSLRLVVSLTGVVAVGTSIMVYVATQRPCWSFAITGFKFTMTSLLLGISTVFAINSNSKIAVLLSTALIASMAVKLIGEIWLLNHARDRRNTHLKRSAKLMLGALSSTTHARFICGATGGIVLPLLYLAIHQGQDVGPVLLGAIACMAALLTLSGEVLERSLFFKASMSARMPGGRS